VFDENASLFIDDNIAQYAPNAAAGDPNELEESNLMHGINGLVYGNNTGYVMRHAVKPLWAELGSACVCRVQHRPQGKPGHNKVVAIARVLSAAGAPDRYHER